MRAAVAGASRSNRFKVQSFADDFKFTFHSAAEPAVGGVGLEGVPGAALLDALCRFLNVEQQLLFLSPHRRAGAWLR